MVYEYRIQSKNQALRQENKEKSNQNESQQLSEPDEDFLFRVQAVEAYAKRILQREIRDLEYLEGQVNERGN